MQAGKLSSEIRNAGSRRCIPNRKANKAARDIASVPGSCGV